MPRIHLFSINTTVCVPYVNLCKKVLIFQRKKYNIAKSFLVIQLIPHIKSAYQIRSYEK